MSDLGMVSGVPEEGQRFQLLRGNQSIHCLATKFPHGEGEEEEAGAIEMGITNIELQVSDETYSPITVKAHPGVLLIGDILDLSLADDVLVFQLA